MTRLSWYTGRIMTLLCLRNNSMSIKKLQGGNDFIAEIKAFP